MYARWRVRVLYYINLYRFEVYIIYSHHIKNRNCHQLAPDQAHRLGREWLVFGVYATCHMWKSWTFVFAVCVCVEGSQVAEAGLYLQHYIQHRADHADHAWRERKTLGAIRESNLPISSNQFVRCAELYFSGWPWFFSTALWWAFRLTWDLSFEGIFLCMRVDSRQCLCSNEIPVSFDVLLQLIQMSDGVILSCLNAKPLSLYSM